MDTIVKIYNDRIEIISLGEIPSNISPKGLTLGISVCRNDEIMEVFRYLGITSRTGKGIEKILREYKEYKLKPTIESLGGVYRITLSKISYTINGIKIKKTYRKILDILDEKGTITNEELQALIGLTSSGVIKNLKEMLELGLIEKIREGRNIRYKKVIK
ncbi:ATP-binding protein [Fusobacterium perfoetens]|uniref:ATP-binding protein n=1 Tax=Fusobacterium TaxID=848 RepID=UPI001476B326|nr:ATP-binding protein [Fusobacterium perfoetens]NME35876.1 winged helix-turn-helix transcriptional regulator [Fusobacterium sp. FSA-380-WT-3A]